MTMAAPNPLATVVRDLPDGLCLELRGELSSATVPALESLLHALRDGGERRVVIDLRDTVVVAPLDRVLQRWDAAEASPTGTYEVRL